MTARAFVVLVAMGCTLLPLLRRLYRYFAKWPAPTSWSHPAGRIRQRKAL